jgi:hypothetical protein
LKKKELKKELPIIQQTYDLILWYVPLLNRLPREHKFLLGDRIASCLYDLLGELIQCRYAAEKLRRLHALNGRLDVLRYQTRLLKDPIKSQLFETREGASFLGFRILPQQVRVKTQNLRRARKRLRTLQSRYRAGDISLSKLKESLSSWIAHLDHGDTWKLREQVFAGVAFTKRSGEEFPS